MFFKRQASNVESAEEEAAGEDEAAQSISDINNFDYVEDGAWIVDDAGPLHDLEDDEG